MQILYLKFHLKCGESQDGIWKVTNNLSALKIRKCHQLVATDADLCNFGN
jgi:hypothetical protein